MERLAMPIDLRPEAFSAFYAQLGMCITAYQQLEDRLEGLFRAAMPLPNKQSDAIFLIVKGLEDKHRPIDAAMLTQKSELAELWYSLRVSIKTHADFRNKIAHVQLTVRGKGITIYFDDEGNPSGLHSPGPPEMEGSKATKNGRETFTLERLKEEYGGISSTSRRQTSLIQILNRSKPSSLLPHDKPSDAHP